jgi:hypothetical protein
MPADQEASLRDTISEAFEAQETPKEEEAPPKEETPPKEEEAPPKEETPKEETPPKEELAAKAKPEKGPDGKFIAKEKPKEEEAPPPAEKQPKSRAPGSWKPSAREKWAGLPPEIQQEILRREADMARGFNQAGDAIKFRDGFAQMMAPYQGIIAAEGGNGMKFINDLLITAGGLYNGTPTQKVNIVAGLIRNFGVDLQLLDSTLAGQPPVSQGGESPNIQAQINAAVHQALAPLLRGQQANEERSQQEVANEIEAFASDPKNEFFADVRETMADLLEMAAKQGKTLDLQTAYKRATLMHDDIASVVQERQLKEKAAAASAKAVAAKKKAVSVTGAPAKEPAAESQSLRSDIEAAIEQLGT